jgi:hypothetical protein
MTGKRCPRNRKPLHTNIYTGQKSERGGKDYSFLEKRSKTGKKIQDSEPYREV